MLMTVQRFPHRYLLAVSLLFSLPHSGAIHGGVLKLADRRLIPGNEIRLVGEKFEHGSVLILQLVGMSARVPLGEVHADSLGAFVQNIPIPPNVMPGSYRLIAIATDGDVAAGLDVEVLAPGPEEQTPAREETQNPSAVPLALERARSPLVTGAAVTGIIVALAFAVMLLRRRP